MDQSLRGEVKVPKRILNNLLSALVAGVVPRQGAPYIAIGRTDEIRAMTGDLDNVKDGGTAVRFLIGRYGSGKSFLIQLMRGYAMDRGFLTADADLSPERRLSGGSGAGVATYRELIRNLACKAAPDGEALTAVLARQDTQICSLLAESGIFPEDAEFSSAYRKRVFELFSSLESGVGGFDFARVVCEYFFAVRAGQDERKSACLRWLRGEFANKTEARAALGFPVSGIIDDDNWYDILKLWSRLAVKLGYAGLLVCIDECINLYKIPNRISRESNYEKLLAIFNDALQGRAEGLFVLFGGTPQFLEDPRRGLFSYEALRSRLADSRFVGGGYVTMASPVIRLRRLSDTELFALLRRLTVLFSRQNGPVAVSDSEMQDFLARALARAGADEMITPRDITRDYLTVLYLLKDNPGATFADIVNSVAGPAEGRGQSEEKAPTAPSSSSVTLDDFEL